MTSACKLVRWMTQCVSCNTCGDDEDISTGAQRRDQKTCRGCSLAHHANSRGRHALCRRGGKKIPRVATSSCDPAIVSLFGSSSGCPVCKHSCQNPSTTTTTAAGDLFDMTKSRPEISCGLNSCDISDFLMKDGEMISDHFLLPPAEPICCCSWCYHVRSRLMYELETATRLPALEDGCLRMRNCVLVQRQEERLCGHKKDFSSRDVSCSTERSTLDDEKILLADKKLPANDQEILLCPVVVIPTTNNSSKSSARVRELKLQRPLADFQSDFLEITSHKSAKNAVEKEEPVIADTKGGGSAKVKSNSRVKHWDKGRSEITQSWVIPAPNRTICHIWDTLPVGLDDVLNQLGPSSGGDRNNVVPSSPVTVRCCCFSAVKRTDFSKNKYQKKLSSQDFVASMHTRYQEIVA